jgi:hypothetical protein
MDATTGGLAAIAALATYPFHVRLAVVKLDVTADDLWPLVSKLSPQEQVRLAKLALRAAALGSADDAAAYAAAPVKPDEFSSDDDPLAWEAEGWEGLDAPR